MTPLPSLEVEQAEQVVNGWQASSGREEKNISVCSALPLVLSVKGAPSGAGEAETALEVSTTFSDASSVSSDKTILSKKLLHMSQKRKTKAALWKKFIQYLSKKYTIKFCTFSIYFTIR